MLFCIANDPRVDPQIERRERYYGELALALELPCSEILLLAINKADGTLAPSVLAEMAARGNREAFTLLTDPDAHLPLALEMADYLRDYPIWAAQFLPFPVIQRLAEHGIARGDLDYDVEVHAPFWQHFDRRLPAIADAFARNATATAAEQSQRTELADPAKAPTELLLDSLDETPSSRVTEELSHRRSLLDRALLAWRVEHDASVPRRHAAARALGAMQDLRLLELAEATFQSEDDLSDPARTLPIEDRQRRTALLAYVLKLPAKITLPLARRWWGDGRFLRTAAGRILELHAEPEDREWLTEFVARTLQHDSGLEMAFEIDALVHIGDRRSLAVLQSVTRQATCSWTRTRALLGLARHPDDPLAHPELADALWDCESEARELGCRYATISIEEGRRRCGQLAADPIEEGSVREAAAERLNTGK